MLTYVEATAVVSLAFIVFGAFFLRNFSVIAFAASILAACWMLLHGAHPMRALEAVTLFLGVLAVLFLAHGVAKHIAKAVWSRKNTRLVDRSTDRWEPFLPMLPVKTQEGWRWLRVLERRTERRGSSSETEVSWIAYRDIV